MNKKKLTMRQVANKLDICIQRVSQKLHQGHFPNHGFCECGRTILIPESDLEITPLDKRKKPKF